MSKFHDLDESRRKAEQVWGGAKEAPKESARPASDTQRETDAAKTARLRAARLAKEAAERAAAPPAPVRAARRKSTH